MNYLSGKFVRFEYDAAGRQTSMTDMRLRYFGNTYLWTYAYDAANRLTSLQSPGVAKANTFTYNAVNLPTKATYANNATVNCTYDYARQLKSISSNGTTNGTDPYGNTLPDVSTISYTYDKAGRRTYFGGNGNQYYQYDAGSRLTASGPSSSATEREYYYDLVGNRHTLVTNSGDPKGVFTYVYDQANRLIEEFGPIASKQGGGRYHQSYTYDADGNQTRAEKDGKEVTLYFYDEASRLQQVTNPLGQLTRYTYFGDGRRAAIEEPAGTTRFIYDGNEVLAEVDATGAIQVLYTRMPSGQLVSQWRKGETYWHHLDGLGSTVALTDESGRVRNRYSYDDFGRTKAGTAEEIFNRYTYTGQAWDATAGLYHYKARYYNPDIGRFITQDTYKGSEWAPWTQHLYTYVGNNPVNFVDPTGHCREPGNLDAKWWNPTTWFFCEGIDWTNPFPETRAIFGSDLMDVLSGLGMTNEIMHLNSIVAMHDGKAPRKTVSEATLAFIEGQAEVTFVYKLGAAIKAGGGAAQVIKTVINDQTGGFKIPSFKNATSRELRKFAEKAGLEVVSGGEHLKVMDAAGNLVTTIPHTLKSPWTAKSIIESILKATGGQ